MPISTHMQQNGKSFVSYLQTSVGESEFATVVAATVPSPVNFDTVVAANRFVELERVNITSKIGNLIKADTFFGIPTLTNGMLLQVLDDTLAIVETFQTDVVPIRQHHDFAVLAGVDVNPTEDSSGAASVVNIRWTIGKSGKPFLLRSNWRFRVVVQDPLNGLDSLRFMFQGVGSTSYLFTTE